MKCIWCQKGIWWRQPNPSLHSACRVERAKYPSIASRVEARHKNQEATCEA